MHACIATAIHRLAHGGVIAYPTETVFGLGCDPLNPDAVVRLLQIKKRSWKKGLILIAAEFEALREFIRIPNSVDLEAILRTWPGPNTWVFPSQDWVPDLLTGKHQSIAVRISSHPQARQLCLAWGGALVSTSANHSGRPVVRNRYVLRRQFGGQLDYVLPGACGLPGRPSVIRDAVSGRIYRH